MTALRFVRYAGALLFALVTATRVMAAASGFITADGRADIAYDTARQVLYISGGAQVRRYDMVAQAFLPPIAIEGTTKGMDISADGKFLAVANGTRGAQEIYVDIITLKSGRVRRLAFPRASGEGGTHSVAYDADGKLLLTTRCEGSCWTPLRRYDPATDLTETLPAGLGVSNAMANPSPNHRYVAIAEGNTSDGPYGRYVTGDASYQPSSRLHQYLHEIGVAPNGAQMAIPTGAGTFIDDTRRTLPAVGEAGGKSPIGVAYAPSGDVVYFPFWMTNFVAEYDRRTMFELRRFTTPSYFWSSPGIAFELGRTKVSSDGKLLFVTVDKGVFYQELSTQ